MDDERLNVAEKMGYPVESVTEWMKRTYNVGGNNLYECIKNNDAYKEIDAPPSLESRYILEDVPNGLVPIEYIGKKLKFRHRILQISLTWQMQCTKRILGRVEEPFHLKY